MSALVDLPFVVTFSFARPIPADCRDKSGAVVTRAVNVPRFDHSAGGARKGLIVAAGPAFGRHDAISVRSGDWEMIDRATVLHEYEDADGVVQRRAHYSTRPRATVNACLKIAGRHRLIGAVADFLPNLGGFVRYRAAGYELGRAIGVTASVAIGDSSGRPLIES